MRYKLEVPLTARLVNNQFFRRFRSSAGPESRPAILNEVGALYGVTTNHDSFSTRRMAHH